jgi:hypothetical protein
MPGGATHPAVGYLVFGAIKFAGYSLAARFISRRYGRTDRNPFAVGGVRTLVGMVAGAFYFGLLAILPQKAVMAGGLVFLTGLLPLRIAEWWLLLWLFYDRRLEQPGIGWRVVAVATAWSFVLDVPAIAGMFFTGGFWIC